MTWGVSQIIQKSRLRGKPGLANTKRQRAMLKKSRDQPCNLRNDLVFKLLHLSFPAFPHLSTLFTEKTGGAQFIASEAIAAYCGPPKSSDVATVEAICFPSLYTR